MQKRLPYIFFLLLPVAAVTLLSFYQKLQRSNWDPDAGVIPSYGTGAELSSSSNFDQVTAVVDGDEQTAWQSEAPLPEGFIDNPDQNILLHKAGIFKANPRHRNLANATDGNLSTTANISQQLLLDFTTTNQLHSISLKCQAQTEIRIAFKLGGEKNWTELGTYSVQENYALKRFELPGGQAASISLSSDEGFELFEIAGLAGFPKEYVILDFGNTLPVGSILTRHWPGEQAATATKLYLSSDKLTWTEVGSLDPSAIGLAQTNVIPEITARYLKLEHTLVPRDWNKVFVWEIKAYDRYGMYGPRKPAIKGHTTIKDLLGVNGYWSWGTDEYSDKLAPDKGPYRYQVVASHARNYHDMTWDINSPSDVIDFGKMAAGKGTPAKEWLNWDREYNAWHQAGLAIQASLQFYQFQPSDWKNPAKEARAYATAFVSHFGQKNGNGLICTIEAGNEPWHYPAETYRQILLGMAQGSKDTDPYMEVFPCALQAANPAAEKQDGFKNYMGARISKETAALLDGINIHAYSYEPGQHGQRKALHPEHPNSSFWEVLNAIRWRDVNMPGKKIYLSEWGWDHSGGGEVCTHQECVSEEAGASYAVRGAMIALRLGIDRATWFYYANENRPSSLYTRSGLTSSAAQQFAKKKSFYALEALVKMVGSKVFLKILQEDEIAWIYLLGDANGTPTHLIAWRPVQDEGETFNPANIKIPFTPGSAYWLDGIQSGTSLAPTPVIDGNGNWKMRLSAKPMLVSLSK